MKENEAQNMGQILFHIDINCNKIFTDIRCYDLSNIFYFSSALFLIQQGLIRNNKIYLPKRKISSQSKCIKLC